MLDLKSHLMQMRGHKFETCPMTCVAFLRDLKSLTVGIQSDIFYYNESMLFWINPFITVEGLLPETVNSYAQIFQECGTCYKCLQTLIQKKDYKFMFEGFIFRVSDHLHLCETFCRQQGHIVFTCRHCAAP